MSRVPLVLALVSTLCAASAAAASGSKSTALGVSVTVVASCGVHTDDTGTVDVRCARGAADRVMVSAAEPKVVVLERDTSRTSSVQVQAAGEPESSGERFVTLQF